MWVLFQIKVEKNPLNYIVKNATKYPQIGGVSGVFTNNFRVEYFSIL